jgi:hypothetical protein
LSSPLVISPANNTLSSVFPWDNLISSAGPVFLIETFFLATLISETLIFPAIEEDLNCVSSPLV